MTQTIQLRNAKIAGILRAIEDLQKQNPQNQQKPNQSEQDKVQSTGKMDREKCEKFSDYMTDVFIATCNNGEISNQFQNWKDKSDAERLKLASDIVRVFLQNISKDITKKKVPTYQRDGTEYKKTNNQFDTNFADDMAKMPEILVQQMEKPKPNDGMNVTTDKKLNINLNNPAYKSNLAMFLADIRHELTHFIDIFVPGISPLDADVRQEAMKSYVSPHENEELYKQNPLEVNANMKRAEYMKHIEAMLILQETQRNRAINMNFISMRGREYACAA